MIIWIKYFICKDKMLHFMATEKLVRLYQSDCFCIFLLLLCLLITMEFSCFTELLLAFFFHGQNCQIMAHIKKRMSLLFPAYRLCHCYSIPSKGKCNCPLSSREAEFKITRVLPLYFQLKKKINWIIEFVHFKNIPIG